VSTELLLACDAADAPLGAEVESALAAAGFRVARWTGPPAPGSHALAVVLVTRKWARSSALNDVVSGAAAAGLRTVLAWWDEDAPSDFLTEEAAHDEVFYACFLPRPQRAPALVERLRDELTRT
jgi:hypothetical protein